MSNHTHNNMRRGGAVVAAAVMLFAGSLAPAQSIVRLSVATDGTEADQDGSFDVQLSANAAVAVFRSGAMNLVPGDNNGFGDVFWREVFDRRTGVASATAAKLFGDGTSRDPAVNWFGDLVLFSSRASNLVGSDFNGAEDVFLQDRFPRVTVRVNLAAAAMPMDNGEARHPWISADGRFVVFEATGANLVPIGQGARRCIYLRDLSTATTTLISRGTGNTIPDGPSAGPVISAGGRHIAFHSNAENLVPGDNNGISDVFVYDRITETMELVSLATDGTRADVNGSRNAAISADGRYVAFESGATRLVPGDSNGCDDIFLRDREENSTRRISLRTDRQQHSNASGEGSNNPAITADGLFVAYDSAAPDIVPEDSNGRRDIFVVNTVTLDTVRVNLSQQDEQAAASAGNAGSTRPAISACGRFIAFQSDAENLVPMDDNGIVDIFIRDRGAEFLLPGMRAFLLAEDGRPCDVNLDGALDAADLIFERHRRLHG